MDFEFHPEAADEFKAQVRYYEARQTGLGADFADEIFRLIDMACSFPEIGAPHDDGVRSLVAIRFPFILYYEVRSGCLVVWSVMHGSRKPDYWKAWMN